MSDEKTYKIKIDLGQGLFEAEGSKEFVEQNFANFQEVIKEKKNSFVKEKSSSESDLLERKNKKKRNAKSSSFSIVKDLNLKPQDKDSLKKFFEEKNPETNIENNAVFVYYLEKMLAVEGITPDHIFSCYKEIGLRIPGNLRQSIVDTGSSRYGYIDASSMQDIKIIVRGENMVIHDLPKKGKEDDKK